MFRNRNSTPNSMPKCHPRTNLPGPIFSPLMQSTSRRSHAQSPSVAVSVVVRQGFQTLTPFTVALTRALSLSSAMKTGHGCLSDQRLPVWCCHCRRRCPVPRFLSLFCSPDLSSSVSTFAGNERVGGGDARPMYAAGWHRRRPSSSSLLLALWCWFVGWGREPPSCHDFWLKKGASAPFLFCFYILFVSSLFKLLR